MPRARKVAPAIAIPLSVLFVISASAQGPIAHLPRNDTLYRQPLEATAFHGCPDSGRKGTTHAGGHAFDANLNRRKNRIDVPKAGYLAAEPAALLELPSPDLSALLRTAWPQHDSARTVLAYEGLPLVVEGYLAVDTRYPTPHYGAQAEGPESTNCAAPLGTGDVHVWVTPDSPQDKAHAFVVELTPRPRELFHQDSARVEQDKLVAIARQGRKVRVSGWLLYDQEHPEQLHDRTLSNGVVDRQVRATLWELHPVMTFEVKDGSVWVDLKSWQVH